MLDIDPEGCSPALRALAEPERLRILRELAESPRTVGDLAAALDRTIVVVSHHLQALRRAGMVAATKRGRFVEYALAAGRFVPGKRGAPDRFSLGCCTLEVPARRAPK